MPFAPPMPPERNLGEKVTQRLRRVLSAARFGR
jgi:hypothetical protein